MAPAVRPVPDQLGADIDEGTKAVFASLTAEKAGRGSDNSYPAQQGVVNALVRLTGQRTLEDVGPATLYDAVPRRS